MLLSEASSGVHYLGCFLVAGGLYVVVGLPLAWVSCHKAEEVERGNANPVGLVTHQLTKIRKTNNRDGNAAHHWQYVWYNVSVHISPRRRTTICPRTRCDIGHGWSGRSDICCYVVMV